MVNDTRAEYDHLQTLSDEALCALVKQGSRDAEEILVGRYHRLVRSCARPYFLAGGDSEDLLQEGMFGLIKAIREYEPGHSVHFCRDVYPASFVLCAACSSLRKAFTSEPSRSFGYLFL